jgi:hypothetical protein
MELRAMKVSQKAVSLILVAMLTLMLMFAFVGCKKEEALPVETPAATEQPQQDEPVYSNTVETPVEPLDPAEDGGESETPAE